MPLEHAAQVCTTTLRGEGGKVGLFKNGGVILADECNVLLLSLLYLDLIFDASSLMVVTDYSQRIAFALSERKLNRWLKALREEQDIAMIMMVT
jgi:hypothetical protein